MQEEAKKLGFLFSKKTEDKILSILGIIGIFFSIIGICLLIYIITKKFGIEGNIINILITILIFLSLLFIMVLSYLFGKTENIFKKFK